jgi:hypothetical protein
VPGVNFGDGLLARLPFPDGGGFKLRPVLVILNMATVICSSFR